MSLPENVEIVRRAIRAWTDGDVDRLIGVLHPDCVLDMSARVFNPDAYVGHEGFRRFAAEVSEVWERFEFDPDELIEAGGQVVALGEIRGQGRGSGIEVDRRSAFVWTVQDGLVTRGQLYSGKAEALEAVGLAE